MVKILAIIVAALFGFSLIGCAHQAAENPDTLPTTQSVAADSSAPHADSGTNLVDIAEAFLGLLFHAFMELPIILMWVL